MLCAKCGENININNKFCEKCGNQLLDRDIVHMNKKENILFNPRFNLSLLIAISIAVFEPFIALLLSLTVLITVCFVTLLKYVLKLPKAEHIIGWVFIYLSIFLFLLSS